jgi:protease-4
VKKRTAWILVAAVAAVAVGAAAVGALAILLRGGSGSLGANNYLFVRLEGDLPEQPPSSDLESLFERRPASLRTLLESLERSAGDPKVTGVVVRVSMLPGTGWGKVQELREAITRFRKSGKPAYAHIEFCGNKEYYLATACSKIYAVPTALVGLSGLEAEVTFLRKTLDKVGIEAQFEGVGKYKNAPNQFTETGFTEPHREQMEALLDSLHGQFVEAIAKGRGKTEDEIQALIDAGPYDAVQAKEAGLVDDLLYQDQIEERLKNAARTTPGHYLRAAKGLTLDSRPHVALVYAVGDIVVGESQSGGGLGGDGLAGSDTVAGALRQARDDESIKAVVFRVDSPGGFGPAADVIWREVQLTRKSKPVVVSMGDYAASGGYYISMTSDGIVAQPGTITGSIGVFGGKFNLKGFYDKIGLSKEILVRGKHAALYSEYRPWTDEERSKIRSQMVAFYKDFVSRVAEGRKKSYDEVDAIAQGRVWTGVDAKRLGLVDELGGFDVALALAKKKAGIPKDQETTIVIFPERKGLFEALMERQDEGAIAQKLPSDVRSMLRWLTLLGDGVPMARLPFELRIR